MKYYGAPYDGLPGQYDLSNLKSFENPYDALKYANIKWNAIPENGSPRLLVVVTEDYISNTEGMAFFQFTDAKSCANFIADKKEIIWSYADINDQKWNGNAHMM